MKKINLVNISSVLKKIVPVSVVVVCAISGTREAQASKPSTCAEAKVVLKNAHGDLQSQLNAMSAYFLQVKTAAYYASSYCTNAAYAAYCSSMVSKLRTPIDYTALYRIYAMDRSARVKSAIAGVERLCGEPETENDDDSNQEPNQVNAIKTYSIEVL